MNFGSLFSGVGGIDLALERAGMTPVFQVEIDPACRAVLEHHWPKIARYGDVRELHGSELPAVDVLCGGFPCQDLSLAGERAGLAGERSGLWFEFCRLIAECSPRWVLIENVPGLLSSNQGEDFAVILQGLEELGYGWSYRVLDAQHFGVPQRRRRVFVVGCAGDTGATSGSVLFEPESCNRNHSSRQEKESYLAGDLASGSAEGINVSSLTSSHGGADDNDAQAGHLIVGALTARGPQTYGAPEVDAGHYISWPARIASTLNTAYGPKIGIEDQHINSGAPLFAPVENDQVRRLTPLECERLMGLPENWTMGSDSTRYHQCGNSVVVPVVEWIARRMVAAHE